MKRKIFAGTTSLSLPVIVYDNTSTTGAGLSGLTHSTSGLVLEYRRSGQSSWTSVTLVSKTLGTYTSGGIVASGSRAGRYEVDIPDAAVAAGVRMVEMCLRGAASMHPVDIEIELDAVNYQDATSFGLSRIDAATSSRMATYTQPTGFLAATFPATVASTTNITAASGITLAAVTHTGATIPNVTTVDVVSELGSTALSGNALDEAIAILVWEQLTTATWPTDSFGKQVLIGSSTQRTVAVTGSHHVASVLHDAEPNSIPEDAFVTGALSARVLAADAATEIATAVGTLQVLTRLDSMIESDGAGQFRFDTIALSMAPAGGGGGGSTTVNVYPVSASTPERVAGTTLTFYRDESRAVSVVTDFTLTSLTLRFVVEDNDGNDVLVIENAAITKSSQTFTLTITTAVTANLGNYRWSMRDITTGNSVIAFGVLTVQEAASKDA
jgi:hypothetical protein